MQLLPLLLPAFCFFLAAVQARSTAAGLTAEEKDQLANSMGDVDLEARKARLEKLAEGSEPTNPGLRELLKKIKKVQIEKDEDEEDSKDISQLNKESGVAGYMFEDDVNISEDDLAELENQNQPGSRTKRQASIKLKRWTNATVNYFFDNISEENQATVRVAIGMIEANTCLRYIENPNATARIRIFSGKGCWSNVGMTGKQQSYSMGNGCAIIGQVIHELSHALGIWHEQARTDRDDYVYVDYSQIASGKGNFNKNGNNYIMTPYEYSSNMHYAANYMTGDNTGYSLVPHDINYLHGMGGRQWSFYDIQMLNEFYSCNENCNLNTSVQCANGGLPNPNNCSVCICPRGFAGALCDEKPQSCGETLVATETPQNLSITYGNASVSTRYFRDCTYWIQAPPGYNVQIKLLSFKDTNCNFGCYSKGLEIKYMPDPRISNPRWCCKEYANTTLISYQNPTPVVAYTRGKKATYKLEYVAIPSSQVPPAPDSITVPPGMGPTRKVITTTTVKTTTGASAKSTSTTTTTTTTTTTPTPTPTTTTAVKTTTKSSTNSSATVEGETVVRDCHSALDSVNCAFYKKSKWCDFMQPIDFRNVKWQCGVECGVCGKQAPDCKDYESDCAAYKKAGKCNSEDPMVAEFKCPMSCGFCTNPN